MNRFVVVFSVLFLVMFVFLNINIVNADIAPILDNGLVLYYTFDDATGQTIIDESGNNNNGIANSVSLVEGKFGNAMLFNGSRFVNVSDSATLRGMANLTVSFWAYTYSYATQYSSFFSRWAGGAQRYFIGGYFDGGNLAWFVSDGTNTKNIVYAYPSTLSWHFFTFVFDGTDYLYYYLDGQQMKNDTTTIATISNDVATGDDYILKIGKYSTYYYNGLIDDFRIYNRVLSVSEIVFLYESLQPTPSPSPTPSPTSVVVEVYDYSYVVGLCLLGFLLVVNIYSMVKFSGWFGNIFGLLIGLFTFVISLTFIFIGGLNEYASLFCLFVVVVAGFCMLYSGLGLRVSYSKRR